MTHHEFGTEIGEMVCLIKAHKDNDPSITVGTYWQIEKDKKSCGPSRAHVGIELLRQIVDEIQLGIGGSNLQVLKTNST